MAIEDACRPVIASCFFFLWQLRMLAAWWLHLVFLSMAIEDACSLVIASCFSFYGNWGCLLLGNCILLFFLWHLRMLAAWWLHLAFLSMAIEDACCPMIASCFFFLWHLRMLAVWWLHLVFLSMVLEDACCLVIASCFSFYGTWGCLQTDDCILFFFLWLLRMLADRWLHLVFLSMALEDACCPVIASCFSFYGSWGCLLPDDCILLFLSMVLEDACCLMIASCFFFLWHLRMLAARWLHLAFSFYGTWRCLQPDDCILFFFLWHLKMLAAWWLHLVFLSMALEDACCLVIASCFSFYGTWGCLPPG